MYAQRPSKIADAMLWHASSHGTTTVLPDGCMDILSVDGHLLVTGVDTGPSLVVNEQPTQYIGLRFGSGILPCLLDISAAELADQRVPLEQLLPSAEVRRLQGRLAEWGGQIDPTGFEQAVGALLRELGEPRLADKRHLISAVAQMATEGRSVSSIASQMGYSDRQLQRICRESFGYGLATLIRVTRFQSAYAAIREGSPLSWVAHHLGYADQSHMTRDFVRLSGTPPSRLA